MDQAKKLLIIDDDVELTQLLGEYLIAEGYRIDAVHNGVKGIEAATSEEYDLILLDIMLPELSGLEILKRIRAISLIPILMLTAKGDDADRILGLELGADDYVPKPASAREILARVRAILRRIEHHGLIDAEQSSKAIFIEGLLLDPAKRMATLDAHDLKLTSTEFRFLEILLKNIGSVVSKEILSKEALGRPIQRFDRNIDVHISRIREKLNLIRPSCNWIHTVHRQGYQFVRGT